jgi:hypothetical protein
MQQHPWTELRDLLEAFWLFSTLTRIGNYPDSRAELGHFEVTAGHKNQQINNEHCKYFLIAYFTFSFLIYFGVIASIHTSPKISLPFIIYDKRFVLSRVRSENKQGLDW